ncbi:MAG: hypothetical protein ABIF08_02485 [Nanoarchaeota archaeon]
MMKNKKLILGILLLVVGIVFISGCVQDSQIKIPAEVDVYKGTWTPTLLSDDPYKLASDMQKLKDIGMNTVFFQGAPPQVEHCLEGLPSDSELVKKMKKIIPIQEELMIANIQAAHRNGLRVALTMAKCSGGMGLEDWIDLEAWNSKVIEYARLAEEYDVEFFAPMNEPEVLFGPSASATWGQEILPRIKEVYHGEVIWKGGSIGGIQPYPMTEPAPTNYSGYDYIGVTISRGLGTTLEEFSPFIDYTLSTFLGFAERDNCKGVIITEFYGTSLRELGWSEELDARAHEIVLEKGKDTVAGFFVLDFLELSFLGEDIPGLHGPEESSKTEEVIRRWFTELL